MGTMSLSAVYTALLLSSLFLAPLAVEVLGCRKSMAFGTLAYAIYTIGIVKNYCDGKIFH